MNTRVVNSDAVTSGWTYVVKEVVGGTPVLVEQSNKPVVAVISYEDFVAVQEQLEDLHDLRLAEAAIDAYEHDPSTARSWDDIKAEWDARDAANGA